VSFHASTRYWITGGRGIKANAALGIKYHSGVLEDSRNAMLTLPVCRDGGIRRTVAVRTRVGSVEVLHPKGWLSLAVSEQIIFMSGVNHVRTEWRQIQI
jgi:hypothetical protein